jgi:hypothetical protein
VLAIICLQLPFELAYAHLYEITETEVMRWVDMVTEKLSNWLAS